ITWEHINIYDYLWGKLRPLAEGGRGGWRRSPLCGLLSLPDKIKEKIESKYQKMKQTFHFLQRFYKTIKTTPFF
ncbi:MAG: hypothetical protein JTJ20_08825, partial [Blautia sp.]|nr:hypothetical protein [Blautia sp.]